MPDLLNLTIVAGEEVAERIDRFDSGARSAIMNVMSAALYDLRRAAKRNLRQTHHKRTGNLNRSLTIERPVYRGGNIIARFGSNEDYAEIQEKGGTIHAKNAHNLTIPLEAFMTSRGDARGSAHGVIADPGGYGFDSTFFASGVLFGARGTGDEREVTPLFALKPSVTLPARPYLWSRRSKRSSRSSRTICQPRLPRFC